MDQMDQALRELERLQGIIDRHEGHIFTLRGWLITVVGAIIAAYYADNIQMSDIVLRVALPIVAVLFIVMELRHINLVEAVAQRAVDVENRIVAKRESKSLYDTWYDGPKVSKACEAGATRLWPRHGMTLVLYLPVYAVILAIVISAVVWLPPHESPNAADQAPPPAAQQQVQP